ncbi:MAG: Hpt domain-containing protein [Proteobacteria bacterium]|nr:Hpt domain-containing protein [Pseudomonadota bacterium]
MVAPVDLERLNQLTDGDPDFTRELASAFSDSGHQQLAEIEKALEASDRAAIARAAHKLKGASANLYAEALTELALRLETEAPTGDIEQLRQVSAALRQEFARTNEFLSGIQPL